jgi:hypothetical protein
MKTPYDPPYSTEIVMLKNYTKLIMLTFCFATLGCAQQARAADCVIHTKRMACPGQDAEAYKKCGGKQECDSENDAATEEACMKAALADCEIRRPGVISVKAITASFKAKTLKGGYTADGKHSADGPNFCPADRPDFNKCK